MNILLLRGLFREQRHWGDFESKIKEQLPQAKVFYLDLPGAGTEHGRQSPNTVPEISADIRKRWLKLRDEHRGVWTLVAVSLGGMVALDWGANHPEDFKTITLINTSAGDLGFFFERFNLAQLPRALKIFFSKDPLVKEKNILKMTTKEITDLVPIAQKWSVFQKDRPMLPSVAIQQMFAGSAFKAPLSIAVPTLILNSKGDALVSPKCSERLAKRLNSDIETHARAGHDLPLEDGPWVAEKIKKFYKSESLL